MDGKIENEVQEGIKEEETSLAKMYMATRYFKDFFNFVFSENIDGFLVSEHFDLWSEMFQNYHNTCILAPRKHAKSTVVYAYLMWKIMLHQAENKDLEILYISYKEELAAWHIKQMKTYVKRNPYFGRLKDLTNAEGVGKYSWDGKFVISIVPAGILSFVRGRRADIVILDDVLADPTTMLDLGVIKKVNQRVFEDILPIPKEGGEVKVIGTAQTYEDFFFKLKDSTRFKWGMFPAIENEKEKKVLWPSLFPYERLMEIRDQEIGKKAFNKEYLLSPVYTEESFFAKDELMLVVKKDLRNRMSIVNKDNEVIAGWDIGKKAHPSHLSVFEMIPTNRYDEREEEIKIARMLYHKFYDKMDYIDQLKEVKLLVEMLKIDRVYWDATRGELDGFMEQGLMDRSVFMPIRFNVKSKNSMASEFEKRVNQKTIEIINHQRLINLILTVTNDLQAVETSEGHGDSFWSIALAVGNNINDGKVALMDEFFDDKFWNQKKW